MADQVETHSRDVIAGHGRPRRPAHSLLTPSAIVDRMTAPGRTPLEITSTANPRVKWLAGLHRRRNRVAEAVTVVEGGAEALLAMDVGVLPQSIYYCAALVDGTERAGLVDRARDVGSEVVALGRDAFARASYRDNPDGIIAVVPDPTRPLEALRLGPRPLVLVCEAVEKPGNLGAMLRTAEAAGVDAVVAASPVADWGNPNVVRASKGTLFAVPVASASADTVASWLGAAGVAIVVATPDATDLVTEVDLTGAVAIVVGAEHAGVGSELRAAADRQVRLPMVGHVNSLNVAAAAAITLYEALRQRL